MVVLQSTTPLTAIPTNLTVPQFLLDEYHHVTRPTRLPRTPCLIDDDTGQVVFIDELRTRSRDIASVMYHRFKIQHDDIVSIMSYNHIDFGPCVWAAHRVGGVVSTLSPTLVLGELVHHLSIARPSLLIVHADCLPVAVSAASSINLALDRLIIIEAPVWKEPVPYHSLHELIEQGSLLPPPVERILCEGEGKRAIAFLAPSSGTTGIQKAVSITHFNVVSMIIQEATFNKLNEAYVPWNEQRFRPGDVCGGFLPLYHIYGLVFNLHYMLYAAMTLVLSRKFHFESFLASIERHQITHLPLVPPQAVLLCKHPAVQNYDLSCVRYCVVAAAPLSASLTEELLTIMPNIHLGQAYGMTETCGAVSMFPVTQKVGTLGSGGQLLPGTTAKVVKEDGTIAQDGEVGELLIKGGQVALGYYGNPTVTSETFVDGWLRTGDQVMFKSGDLFVMDRVKELIKVKGFQVPPAELEGHLLTHTCIADAAVIGVADDFAGELPLGFIVLKPEVNCAVKEDPAFAEEVRFDIFEHVAKSKSSYKWLTGGVIFIDAIPRNASGKILRRLLRQQTKKSSFPVSASSRYHTKM
ncbi:phenylacetyl-CoA ligase [Guyanagaster necrorhizus]|uniref:Phenylacetyl-CoA ligase n=1 Tax=Guyanagaster necrorhizus TaxID=856835 RepID=A0A9P8AM32_9AGAR|nr:phenylacetyl-CoA ligase [Guyanagaster necrorhizus MCA 3950]KAG7440450.1 phenylacetyl-CoA ligase [Guyanagaster necrorhizus MCA 3950]